MGASIEEAISSIDCAKSLEDLSNILQVIIENMGFSGFSFVDASRPGDESPFVMTTTKSAFEQDYRSERLIEVDPCVPFWRRTNKPFSWRDVPLPTRRGKRLPGAIKTMNVARDHGYNDGIVIPFHYVDRLGRPYSSACTLFWTQPVSELDRRGSSLKLNLQVLLIYWAQRAIELAAAKRQLPSRFTGDEVQLTDRERDVLSWAARGKTMSETADILGLSMDTIDSHMRNAMRRMNASTKTEAVAKAIMLRSIDV